MSISTEHRTHRRKAASQSRETDRTAAQSQDAAGASVGDPEAMP
jgi:hypothetical protein